MRNESTNRKSLENCISQAEAARIRGVSQQAITDLIRRGRLTTVSVAGRTFVLRSEIEAFVAQPRTGRPPKKKTGRGALKEALGKTSIKLTARTYKEDLGKYISRAEAARIRGVSQPAIADLIHRGRLTPVLVAGRALLLRSEVEAFIPLPRIGRPPKKKSGTSTPKKKKSKK